MGQNICKKCGKELEIRATKKSSSQLTKPYYYSHYYFCPHCQKLYHDSKFKVINPQTISMNLGNNEKKSLIDEFDVQIWTDGACVHNGSPKAKAAWAFVSNDTEKAGKVVGKQTNNRAEGLAIYHALKWAGEQGYKKIQLHTDSQISLYNLAKHYSFVKANKDIFQDIATIIDKYTLDVYYKKVLGHSGNINNERADKLANTTAQE